MTITPSVNNIVSGEVTTCILTDYDPEATIVVTSGNDNVATASYNDGVITITGVGAGTAVITASDQATIPNIATTTVYVTAAPTFVALTADGSGTGNDTSVFGRQYIINNNLSGVNDIIGVMKNQVNLIKTLSITNQATNAASLAAIAANLVLSINMLSALSTTTVASGKNTVTI